MCIFRMRKIASTENTCHAYDAFREFLIILFRGFPDGAVVKNLLASAWDTGEVSLIPGWGSSPGEANGNPLQYFAWRTSWTEEPAGLQSMGSQRV